MRKKKMLGFFFFSSLGGNGSFLSIKDAVTCLQHHVGYNLVRTRNFCQLIFPCPCARRCAACPHGRQPLPLPGAPYRQRPAVPRARGWQQSPGACRGNWEMSLKHLVLLVPLCLPGGISRGELCCSVLAATPLARTQSPGKLVCFQETQTALHAAAIPPALTLLGSQTWERQCRGLAGEEELTAAACGG